LSFQAQTTLALPVSAHPKVGYPLAIVLRHSFLCVKDNI
jgi:hypothetical protein